MVLFQPNIRYAQTNTTLEIHKAELCLGRNIPQLNHFSVSDFRSNPKLSSWSTGSSHSQNSKMLPTEIYIIVYKHIIITKSQGTYLRIAKYRYWIFEIPSSENQPSIILYLE